MAKYVIKRILLIIPILLTVAILVFTLMEFVPGDPVSIQLGGANATAEQIEELRESMGLNRPYIVRLAEYLKNIIFHFDFGNSYVYGRPVVDELMQRFPNTLIIAIGCVLGSVIIGIPIGIKCAVKANGLFDRASMFITLVFTSMPNFWLALLLVLLFSVTLGWLPSSGDRAWYYYILPIVSNLFGGIATVARQTRSAMLEVIRSDYIVTAKSKGISEKAVIYKHALPNALIPIITICGSMFALMMGGTVITEAVFTIPGLGSYLISGINSRDYPVVQGCVIYIAATFSIVMLLLDIIYAFVDPRIKAIYGGKSKSGKGKSEK